MEVKRHAKRGEVVLVVALVLAAAGLLYGGAKALWGEGAGDFFYGMLRNPMQVGAFSPCSKFVAKEMTRHIAECVKTSMPQDGPLRILEVGAGSGVLTKEIEAVLQNYNGNYIVDVVEIDKAYCDLLERKFAGNKNIRIHCADITSWQATDHYDFIVSSVPFTNLSIEQVRSIFEIYERIIKPGGVVSHVTLMFFPKIKPYFMIGEHKEALIKKLGIVDDFIEKFKLETVNVWLNLTPAYVYHLKIDK